MVGNKISNSFDSFTGINALSKTLRNELIPSDYTKRHIAESDFIAADTNKNEEQYVAKEMMDDYYRDFISKVLDNLHDIEWKNLFELMHKAKIDKSDATSKELIKIQDMLRKKIGKKFSQDPEYKVMLSAGMITKILPKYILEKYETDREDRLEAIKRFYGFTVYFKEFWASRQNVFSDKAIASSISYRIIHENAKIYMDNLDAYNRIKQIACEEIEKIEEEAYVFLQGDQLDVVYTEEAYGRFISQSGIDLYNNICGVINAHMNLYCQSKKCSRSKFKMQKLHKQILCKAETGFEIPLGFQDDAQVINAINSFNALIKEKNIISRLRTIGKSISLYDVNKIYISSKAFENVSVYIDHKWDVIASSLYKYFSEIVKGNKDNREEKIQKEIKKVKSCSLGDLQRLVNSYYKIDSTCLEHEVTEFVTKIIDEIDNFQITDFKFNDKISLIQNEQIVMDIKTYLDKYMSIYHWMKSFVIDELVDKDMEFYSELDELNEDMSEIVNLYNKVRNYVTQKPYSQEKIKLNFGSPTLADGWSKSKEFDNNAIILIRDEKIYLAIFNPRNKPAKTVISGHDVCNSETDYKKMNYYLLPGASKTLPHVFIKSRLWNESHGIPDEILRGYELGKHLKSSVNFDVEFCWKLIDYYKECISCYPNYKAYNFKFADTESYNDISEFYREVECQGYKIDWTYISSEDVEQLDRDGQIYLFQIYNKDFAPNSKGMDNLHTKYLKNIFSEDNLKNIVIKLNGEAELFYRKSSVKKKVEHKKGTILVNKTYKVEDNTENSKEKKVIIESVPDDCYMELVDYWRNGGIGILSDKAVQYKDKVSHYEATMDIVKDRRYTVDKFFIHLPITINFKADGRININEKVLKYIAENDELHVIGIDRGERNLLYVSVINKKGKIVEQKSFNMIESYETVTNIVRRYNYKDKLVNKESARTDARKNWKEIGKIKEIKEGYLSQVIHEISKMVLKYNAIIVMEDLNYGFKRGRFRVERQVYQKFENMLISKLAYLVDKSRKADEPGGVLRGYQLTYIPDSLEKLGSQCGIIFYVPAAYTSKIDPLTGFVNVFNFREYSNFETKLDFVRSLDSIRYDTEKRLFSISFDYDNFKTHNTTLAKTKWVIYLRGERIKKEHTSYGWKDDVWNVESRIKDLFDSSHMKYDDGHNLIEDILELESSVQKKLINELIEIIRLTVQLRNSKSERYDRTEAEYDRIVSPVMDENGRFYDSENYIFNEETELPKDADANGAYCIALKGLYNVIAIKNNWKEGEKFNRKLLSLNNYNWFDFIQNRRF